MRSRVPDRPQHREHHRPPDHADETEDHPDQPGMVPSGHGHHAGNELEIWGDLRSAAVAGFHGRGYVGQRLSLAAGGSGRRHRVATLSMPPAKAIRPSGEKVTLRKPAVFVKRSSSLPVSTSHKRTDGLIRSVADR